MVDEYFIGLRVDEEIWNFLRRYKQYSKISDVVRGLIYDRIEHEEPSQTLRSMVKRLEEGTLDPKSFIKRFRGLKERYREYSRLYLIAGELIDKLEEDGVLYQAVGKLKLQDEKNTKQMRLG